MQRKELGIFSLPVIVGALGFFVDIYDLLLFNITRIKSMTELGVPKEKLRALGEDTTLWQMGGLVIGGILWGMLGDKKGRKSVLFGSIVLYSLATIANGFVTDVNQYTWLRFIAGLGLAGELGASITLVSEMLPKEKRGIGATVIATSGVMGTITAYVIYSISNENWRLCYWIGGGMGLALLFLRVRVLESHLYDKAKATDVQLGNFFMFFNSKERFFRYMKGIIIGLPVWYIIGILIAFSNDFAESFKIEGFSSQKALMLQYVALAFGDMGAGLISNYIKSRKKTLLIYYAITAIFITLFFALKGGGTAFSMYAICMGLGFGSGISVLYITMSAEQFGTNLRATAAVSIPNLVRGSLILLVPVLRMLQGDKLFKEYVTAAWVLGIIVMLCGLIAVLRTKETFGKDLNFIEN